MVSNLFDSTLVNLIITLPKSSVSTSLESISSLLKTKNIKSALIATACRTDDEVMNYLHNIYQGLVRYLKYEDCGEILATGVGYSNIDENSEFLKQAYELGKNLKGE